MMPLTSSGSTNKQTDCRFLHDIQAVKATGGVIIEVVRGDQLEGVAGQHPGDQARLSDEFQALVDIHIANTGTLEDLRRLAIITEGRI